MKVFVVRYTGSVIGVYSSRQKAEKMGRIIDEYEEVPKDARGMFTDIEEYELDAEVGYV